MTYFKSGSWNAICDVCGFKFKADQMKKRWDGLMVCEKDFEHDHPQKYLRVQEDQTSVPWVRNRPPDIFINVCSIPSSSAYADICTADCAKADNAPSFDLIFTYFGSHFSAVSGVAVAGRAISGVPYV